MSFLSEIVGSFSTGSAQNPTVSMMDASFAAEGLDWRYLNCEVGPGDLAAAVAGAKAMGWRGFNCSIPHKQTVIPFLDELSETGAITQAVNCVVSTPNGSWSGHNTDGRGFCSSAAELIELSGCEMLLIGAGGAAHAIGVEAALRGAKKVWVASRGLEPARRLAKLIGDRTPATAEAWPWADPLRLPASVQLVVQATPIGMSPNDDGIIPVAWDQAPTDIVVADVVPNPPHTRFLAEAASCGAATIDGTGMLVNQGAENIRLWTGVEPDRAVLRAALLDAFAV